MSETAEKHESHQVGDRERDPLWKELWDVIGVIALFAASAVAATWLVWYFGTGWEAAGAMGRAECRWLDLQNCISLSLLDRMFTHGAIGSGVGGVIFYLMLARERRLAEDEYKKRVAAESELVAMRAAAESELTTMRVAAERRVDEERERRLAAEEKAAAAREALQNGLMEAEKARREAAERENSDLRRRLSDLEHENAQLRSNGVQEQGHGQESNDPE